MVYIPLAREIVQLEPEEEKQLKMAVIEKGGSWNTSCPFLKNTSDAAAVNSTTGVTRKGVMKLAHRKAPEDVQCKLDVHVFHSENN